MGRKALAHLLTKDCAAFHDFFEFTGLQRGEGIEGRPSGFCRSRTVLRFFIFFLFFILLVFFLIFLLAIVLTVLLAIILTILPILRITIHPPPILTTNDRLLILLTQIIIKHLGLLALASDVVGVAIRGIVFRVKVGKGAGGLVTEGGCSGKGRVSKA